MFVTTHRLYEAYIVTHASRARTIQPYVLFLIRRDLVLIYFCELQSFPGITPCTVSSDSNERAQSHKIIQIKGRPVEGEERGRVFPGPRLGDPPLLKNSGKAVPDGVFLTSNMHKIHLRPALRPRPPLGDLATLSSPSSRIVSGTPPPYITSRSTLSACTE